jgi:anti-anti-sigma factor
MQAKLEMMDDGVAKVILSGRLDLAGTEQIEAEFSKSVGERQGPVLIDLSEVTFIASIGIKMLLKNAKDLSWKGFRTAIFKPQTSVEKILRDCGIDTVIPVHFSVVSAVEQLKQPIARV